MNPWLLACVAVSATLIPCADMTLRGSPERRLVGLEMSTIVVTLSMVLFSIGERRLILVDLPLALAIMNFGGGLVYARFLERHL